MRVLYHSILGYSGQTGESHSSIYTSGTICISGYYSTRYRFISIGTSFRVKERIRIF